MKGPKVVLIGAGSVFFGRQTIWSMVTKEALNQGTLALVEPDEKKLKWVGDVARAAIDATGVALTLELATHHAEVLAGADFVTLAFAVDGVKLRGLDARISTQHGMTMCSADTIGPGGIMRTLREVPRQNEILQDVRSQCPDAWVINWVNPTSAMGIAMMRHFPDLKTMALCDGPHNPRFDDNLMVNAGLVESAEEVTDALRSRVKIRSGGVNHFNWLVEMSLDGKDLTTRIKEKLREDSQDIHRGTKEEGKVALTNQISSQLADSVGYVPMCIWHTQEYLPFFQGHDVADDRAFRIQEWDIEVRKKWMDECRQDMRDIADGTRGIDDFLEKTTADHASDIIESMWVGLEKRFYINTANRGAVTNMTNDAYLEVLCAVDMNGVYPLHFGDMPRPLPGYMQRVLDEHELAVEAAITYDRDILRKAFLASMVAVSIPDVDACIAELLATEREYLPAEWFD